MHTLERKVRKRPKITWEICFEETQALVHIHRLAQLSRKASEVSLKPLSSSHFANSTSAQRDNVTWDIPYLLWHIHQNQSGNVTMIANCVNVTSSILTNLEILEKYVFPKIKWIEFIWFYFDKKINPNFLTKNGILIFCENSKIMWPNWKQ